PAAGAPVRGRGRPGRGSLPPRRRARELGSGGAGRGVRFAFFGAEGKVGSALVPVLERAGHEVRGIELGDEVDVRGLDAAVDFTTPAAAPENVRTALEQGVSCVVGTTGWDPQPLHAVAA